MIRSTGLFPEDNDFIPDHPGLVNDRTNLSVSEIPRDSYIVSGEIDEDLRQLKILLYINCRNYDLSDDWNEDTFRVAGLMLQTFPDALAYMLVYTDRPGFIRRNGVLTLSAGLAGRANEFNPATSPYIPFLGQPVVIGDIPKY